MPTQHQPNAAMKETTPVSNAAPEYAKKYSPKRKSRYSASWGVYDGCMRDFYGTKRALINRLKRISYIQFVDDLRILDEEGRVVYGDIEFLDTRSPQFGDFFSVEEWSECTNCLIHSDQEIDDICAKKDGYYYANSADGGDYGFHKVAPNEFVHVDRCTKDDLFDEETRP